MTGVESTGLLKELFGEIRRECLDLVMTSVSVSGFPPQHSLIVKINNLDCYDQ